MNRRGKLIVSITGIFIVLLALVGLTYAYFLTRITGNENDKSIEVTTANLSVTYNDDMDGDGEPDALMVFENIMPSNTKTYTKTFKVENTGNATASYSVVLDNMVNDFDRNQDLQYTLTRSGVEGNVAEGNLVVGTKQILIPKVEIENEGVHTYTFTLKYIEAGVDQSIDMGKELSFRVNIAEETVTWDTATEGTLLYALKNNQPNGTETTIPGREVSTENEARILTTEDDYGTSYVYRGNVTNNYVNYSGMCWRVVRVQGDGTIKLALADEHGECNAETYSKDNISSAFINDGATYIYSIDNSVNGLIYETSNMPDILIAWKNKKVTGRSKNLDESKLTATDWCNDMSIGEFSYEDPLYNGNLRLYEITTANPTLKCNMKGLENSKALRYESNIGIFTADEVAFAGLTNYGTENYTNYLIINSHNIYWTMTPSGVILGGEEHLMKGIKYFILDYPVGLYKLNAIRPVIALRRNVLATTDAESTYVAGTQQNPYIIE